MHMMTCLASQALQIGEEVEITVIAVEDGKVQLGVTAPDGRRLTCIDPIPLPLEASEIRLLGLERAPGWPRVAPGRKE